MFIKNKFITINGKLVLKKFMLFVAFVMIFALSSKLLEERAKMVVATPKGYLAIVIDDFGYGGEGTDGMLALEMPITCALMPFSSKTSEEAEKIHSAGKEIIVHMPMESLTGKKSWVGDKGIFLNMTEEEVRQTVNEAIVATKYAVGLNNHMGSAIMEDEKLLSFVIDEINSKDMIFVDSKTTPNSKAKMICEETNTTFFQRAVFLDSTDDLEVVKSQLRLSAEKALGSGAAIAIGHVGPEGGDVTVQAINELKDELEAAGIEFVTVSELKEIMYGK